MIRGVRVVGVPLRDPGWRQLSSPQFQERRAALSTALFYGPRGGEVLSLLAIDSHRRMLARIAVPESDGDDPVGAAVALCRAAFARAGLARVVLAAEARVLYKGSVEDWRFEARAAAA